MNTLPFKKLALVGRSGRPQSSAMVATAIEYLRTTLQLDPILETQTAASLPNHDCQTLLASQFKESGIDLIIVVGGDGSMLHAVHIAVGQNIPVVGINRGRLGFLTDIHPDDLGQLGQIIQGDYTLEKRILLHIEVYNGDTLLQQALALNDAVLMPGAVAHMLDFDIYINDCLVCHQRADGLITATPTGSTAYALSAGGPILSPTLNAMVLVPMLPHKLSSRPIVVHANSEIMLCINSLEDTSPCLSCDGMESIHLPTQARIQIKQHPTPFNLIHSKPYNYYNTLRSKLGWESQ